VLIRLKELRLASRHPNMAFWLTFFGLNVLLFAPFYLLNLETTSPWPETNIADDGLWLGINRLFLWRENLDIFRINIELTVLTALWLGAPRLRGRLLRAIFIVFYLAALVYVIYEAVVITIWRSEPIFYSHFFLALDGLPFLAEIAHVTPWMYVVVFIAVVVVAAMVVVAIRTLLASATQPGFRRSGRILMLALAGLCLFAVVCYQSYTASPEMAISSLSYKLERNIVASLQLRQDVARFDDAPAKAAYDYVNYSLTNRPDIFLIFVESYGSVLYKRSDFRAAYLELLKELEAQLAGDGWSMASALSESPTWGGGSWLAYTSLLFGLRIDNQPQYLSLFNKYQLDDYPNLGRALQEHGYTFAWVSSISREMDERVWDQYVRFMGADRWLRYSDLDYAGAHFSWGAAPPDQFVLNYANELLRKESNKPLFFVTITQNSHYPWLEQPPVVEDWRTLKTGGEQGSTKPAVDQEGMEHTERRQNYLAAIDYQLRMLADFVLRNGDDDSVFIFIGDHQPPRVSRRSDGFDTPIHIISRDQALVDTFFEYGFTPGLTVQRMNPSLHHEGFYSLFMRALVEREGNAQLALPAFLPGGVQPAESSSEAEVN
jgi:phosphoglycerol transferase MdoB-like AlkP superfamily enzyme